jgi:lipopolysaccharide transport protein LptA/LPS export ABC transporter protein LptC
MVTSADIRGYRSERSAAGLATAQERLAAFNRARRHTRSVRVLRLALPSAAIIALMLYGVTLFIVVGLKPKNFDPGAVRIDSEHLTMENPKYDGFGKDGTRYQLRARQAVTDIKMSGPIRLVEIDGDLVQQTGALTRIKANWGTYDQKKSELELYERIDIDGSAGTTARLTRATVYAKESRVVSLEPVVAELPSASVRARTMTLNSKSRQISFKEAVEVQLRPNPPTQTDREQPGKAKAPSALPGLSLNSNAPVDVRSDLLDIDDTARTAVFRQNVTARQAEATMTAPELEVAYEGRAALPGGSTQGGQQTATRLKALRARGGVVMIQKEDRATSDSLDYEAQSERATLRGNVVLSSGSERRVTSAVAEFDRLADTALLTGGVVVNQGQNILRGQRLSVDRKVAKSRLDSPAADGQPAGRISATLYRTDQRSTEGATPARDAGRTEAPRGLGDGVPMLGATFKTDPKAPVDVEADTLDILDQSRMAVFKGNVVTKQGAFVVRAAELTARYAGQTGLGLAQAQTSAPGTPKQSAQLTKIEARQKVVITSSDGRTASGDWADFDVRGNTAVVGGKVIVSQGQSIVEGTKLLIDMTTGQSRFEMEEGQAGNAAAAQASPACPEGQVCSKSRIRAVFYPKEVEAAKKKKGDEQGAGASPLNGAKQPSSSSWDSTTTSREAK